MRRLQAVLRPLRDCPPSDPRVMSVRCDYEYLQAEVLAGGQAGSVLAALESLLQGKGQQQGV